jgi:hypothetical protein
LIERKENKEVEIINSQLSKFHRQLVSSIAVAMLLLLPAAGVFAATVADSVSVAKRANGVIDTDQERIDKIDGKLDHSINLGDSALTARANKIYFGLVDSIQNAIDNPRFKEPAKKVMRDNLFMELRRVYQNNVDRVEKFELPYHHISNGLNAGVKGNAFDVLISNVPLSFKTLVFFRDVPGIDSFLMFSAYYRPDLVMKYFYIYSDMPYAPKVIAEAAKYAPVIAKKYLIETDIINRQLRRSGDPDVINLIRINDTYGKASNAYALLQLISMGDLTIEEANAIGKDQRKYFDALIKVRSIKKPLGEFSVEADLEIYALKYVRVLNDLHNEDDKVRFASIENFTTQELYTLVVYTQEEIFTSTFNGLFNRYMKKMGNASSFDFLKLMGENRFRTFIKMSAGYGKLTEFLGSMTSVQKQLLMIKFASGLEQNLNDLSQAVEVADAYASITDTLVLNILNGTIKYEYLRMKNMRNKRGVAIYGLLMNLFVDRQVFNPNWFGAVADKYGIPPIDRVRNNKLFSRDSTDTWMIYFYDDEDGEASFTSFMQSFKDTNWVVNDSLLYVKIESKGGKRVNIYANKPKAEYDGQAFLEKMFAEREITPNIVVHRGHSYYAYKTIDKISDNTQIFVLGSCGGYHSITSIIEKSADISIISSKQIGTMFVNNPMLKLMADAIREGRDVEWPLIWTELDGKIKSNPKAYERFLDYIPPHKNLGALFIKAYNKMIETNT